MTPLLRFDLHAALQARPEWSRQQLLGLLQQEYPELTDATLTWRIHDLKSRGVLCSVGRGLYASHPARPEFMPALDSGSVRLYRTAQRAVPGQVVCLADTAWLNQLRPEAPALPSFRLLEVAKPHLPAVYEALQELSRFTFLAPPAADVLRYVHLHERAVVLRPLVTEAPLLTTSEGCTIGSLEKQLVDALAHADLYAHYQDHLPDLYRYARQHFSLHESRLRRYARRRAQLPQVEALLSV
ncbi:hypothetical protein EJV47_25330 [Hymenobacter gummosus]|uniref:Uncharacterized protein n=1 Tax=Hymenobacter gummosus TaxID=1776032 RepID=A0A3S0JD88_9BACT|nr:DUF6577 family protein [Hymenobacter gummosus]RTQ45462.1 hypothetical protein EJV47_25330 [Hymenobacter gummosus]